MFDQAFSKSALAKCLQKHDFLEHENLIDEDFRKNVIERAHDFAKFGILTEDSFSKKFIKNKPVYELVGLDKSLVLRRANQNIRRIYNVKQNDRDLMIKQLISALKDGTEYNLYKLDIKSFYESFEHESMIDCIESNRLVTYDTKRFVYNLIKSFPNDSGKGLPRGISISATLSEMAMINFDSCIKSMECVYFYFRFVDDIIVITNKKEKNNFVQLAEELLPSGLSFHKNSKKTTLKFNNASGYRDETKKEKRIKIKNLII